MFPKVPDDIHLHTVIDLVAENLVKCDPPEDEAKIREMVVDMTRRYPPPTTSTSQPTTISNFLEDRRPKVRLRGDNRLLSDVASELGPHLSTVLYTRNGEVVEYRDGSLHPISAQQFRTLVERHVTFYRVRSVNESSVQVGATLDESDARGILVSPQFLECLKPLRQLNTVRLPVIRPDGRIELLSRGYDPPTETFTDSQVDYREDVNFSDALETIRDLYGEFQFSDGERSRSIAVAALLGLYAKQLVGPGELRPAFTFTKNAEGAGATTLAACTIIPVCGDLPIGCKAKDDDEVRKALTSAIRAGQDVIFLDNLKGHLNSPALEAFVSAAGRTAEQVKEEQHQMSEGMVYDKSNMPEKQGAPRPQPQYSRTDQGPIIGKTRDGLTYPSLASAGQVEIELPLGNPSGACKVEKVKVCDLGLHIAKQVERGFRTSPTEASLTLNWYLGVCRGAKLLGDKDLDKIQKLNRQFSAASDPAAFFTNEIEPFLASLTPKRR